MLSIDGALVQEVTHDFDTEHPLFIALWLTAGFPPTLFCSGSLQRFFGGSIH